VALSYHRSFPRRAARRGLAASAPTRLSRLAQLSGVAPVTRRSGKTSVVVHRYACNKRLANVLYHWARLATQHDALSRRRYTALRQRGHSHGRALRTVADRLLSVACTLLEQHTVFDPTYKVHEAADA
jgi:transposase